MLVCEVLTSAGYPSSLSSSVLILLSFQIVIIVLIIVIQIYIILHFAHFLHQFLYTIEDSIIHL